MWTLPKEVILKALECCRDIYPHEDDVLIDRSIDGYTILAIEGTKEKTDWLFYHRVFSFYAIYHQDFFLPQGLH